KNELNDSIKKIKLDEAHLKTKITKSQSDIKTLNDKLHECQVLSQKTTNDSEKFKEGIINLKSKKENVESLNKQYQFIKLEIDNLQKAINDLENKQLPSIFEKEFKDYKESITELDTIKENITKQNEKLKKLNQEIQAQKELSQDIEEFVTRGAELADKAQSSVCPLCNYDYKSYNELTAKISNNKFLSQKQSELLKSRSGIEAVLNDLNQSLSEKISAIQSSLQKSLDAKNKKQNSILEKLSENNEAIKNIEAEIKTYQDELNKLNTILNGSTFESYKQDVSESIKGFEKSVSTNNDSLNKIQEDLNNKHSDIKGFENNLEVLKNTLTELKSDKAYNSIVDYFKKEFIDTKPNLELLKQKQTEVSENIQQLSSSIQDISNKVKDLEKDLTNTNEELINKELSELNQEIQILQRNITGFERFLNTEVGLTIEEDNKEKLKAELEKNKRTFIDKIEKAEQKTLKFKLLKELKQNVEPFLKYQKAKKEEAEIIKQKKFLEENVKPLLEQERLKVSDYLDNQISSFFYEDLINDLYKRIDPHPDYKRLKFICDFKDDKPKLNVCLYKDDSDEDPIIPNLYFSTAQLNILSLSIFLAKALNAKDDEGNPIESIFIDDPIQSMDSINILSTIDLFRGIVVNQKKQIILSTHDENFHNLLKKKMPSGLFKSKFMELETFGKVKLE
ncbi:hypothetical protein J1N10_20750, partial [Carboxylicivirga sp. A043]|uniref:hypothetical protein n=1 Tax=Carboxylicivirga litoralis TaxID=2816963 RepID=UPI0021CAFB0F